MESEHLEDIGYYGQGRSMKRVAQNHSPFVTLSIAVLVIAAILVFVGYH